MGEEEEKEEEEGKGEQSVGVSEAVGGGGVRTDGKCVCVIACVLFSSYTYMP